MTARRLVRSANSSESTKVLFIGGYARSGSTVLGRVLGLLDGFLSVDELGAIWERGLAENQPCGCGAPFRSCEFWNAVFDDGFDGMQSLNIDEVSGAYHRLTRWWRIPQLKARLVTSDYPDDLSLHLDCLRRLFRSLRRVAGCRVVVDSSKIASHGVLLELAGPPVDLYCLHLVRDPRATAYSLKWRTKYDPSIGGRLPAQGLIRTSLAWTVSNALAASLRRRSDRYQLIRYEDFGRRPATVVADIIRSIDEEPQELPLGDGRTARFGFDHTVSGNPVRFDSGSVNVKPDEEWRRRMPHAARALVSAVTLPGRHWLDSLASPT